MAKIMIRCPRNGRLIFTGMTASKSTFEVFPLPRTATTCPYCGGLHFWTKADALLQDGHDSSVSLPSQAQSTLEDAHGKSPDVGSKKARQSECACFWNRIGFDEREREIFGEYFDAILESCAERNLVLTAERRLFVCIEPRYLHQIPVLGIPRSSPLQPIRKLSEFLALHIEFVDAWARSYGRVANPDELVNALGQQLASMIRESGAVRKIIEIDRKNGIGC